MVVTIVLGGLLLLLLVLMAYGSFASDVISKLVTEHVEILPSADVEVPAMTDQPLRDSQSKSGWGGVQRRFLTAGAAAEDDQESAELGVQEHIERTMEAGGLIEGGLVDNIVLEDIESLQGGTSQIALTSQTQRDMEALQAAVREHTGIVVNASSQASQKAVEQAVRHDHATGIITAVKKGAAALQGKLKILATWAQISSVIPTTFTVEWPIMFVNAMSIFDIVNLDALSTVSLDCITQINFYEYLILTMVTPMLLALLIWISYLLRLRGATVAAARKIKNQHTKLLLLLMFLVYPSVNQLS